MSKLVELLLNKDVDVNVQNKLKKETALMFAVKAGSDEIVKLLLEKGYSFDRDLSFTLYQGDAHTEAAWATQAADSLRFWITKSL
jgi:ankyrin repeat protein